jgi:phytanoyl-CoA hydroxylase
VKERLPVIAIDDGLLQAFRDDGFVVLPQAGINHVEAIQSDVDVLLSRAQESREEGRICPSGWYGSDGSLWTSDRSTLTQLQLTYRTSAAMMALGMEKVVLDLMERILGPNVELFGEGQCFVKPAKSAAAKHMHQDHAFFIHEGIGQIAALTYLQDTPREMGPLRVVPGSHLLEQVEHGDSSSHLAASADEDASVVLEGRAGDVIIFNGDLLHGSGPNHTHDWRYVAVNRYRTAGDRVTATGTSLANHHEVVVPFAPPGSSAGQEGLLVRGTRPLTDAPGWAWPLWQPRVLPQ